MDFLFFRRRQGLLRSLIEDTSSSCRFIATSLNYDNKIIPPLKSRFQQFTFKVLDKDSICFLLELFIILYSENIVYDPEVLLTYVDVGYPDIRKNN